MTDRIRRANGVCPAARAITLAALFTLCAAPSARAGGLWVYEQAAPGMGRASAGVAAAALDASTAGVQPAGMTRLEGNQLSGGFLPIAPSADFDRDSASTFSGGSGDAGVFAPGLTLNYVHSLSEKLKLGVAVGTYFGAGLDYNDGWAGRYYTQQVIFTTLGANPVVAYRLTDWLSVGGGFSVVLGKLENKSAIRNLLEPAMGDGQLEFEDWDVAVGGNAGILIEPSKATRFGVTYRSKVDFDFKDRLRFTNVGPLLTGAIAAAGLANRNLKLDWDLPQAVMVSAYHDLTDRLALMASGGWQNWSEFGEPQVSLSDGGVGDGTPRSFNVNLGWKDTWHAAIGAQYRINEAWRASLGFAYDSAAITKSQLRSPSFPIDRQIRYAAGVQYDWRPDITLGAAFTYLDAGDANINRSGGLFQGDIKGDYGTNRVLFFNVNVVWRFGAVAQDPSGGA